MLRLQKKRGYEQIAIFAKTADNEKEYAKMWLKELSGIGTTAENLSYAADGGNYEWTDMSCLRAPSKLFRNTRRKLLSYGVFG